jgi:SAM-dependent methyltransferase
MPAKTSAAETFLTEFHNTRPGLTSKAFGELPVLFRERNFSSSYEVLAVMVPRAAASIEVLDLACGDGYLLALLASRSQPGLALSGIDMSFSELRAARARLGPAVALHQAKAQKLAFPSGCFDYVLCHLALMLMDDAEQVMRELRRVLKPGATLAAIVSAAPPPSAALALYVEALSRRPRQDHLLEVRFGDRRFRTCDGISEILSIAFQGVSVDEIHITQRLTPNELWRWFLDTYDLYLLSERDRRKVERDYLSAAAASCGPDGKLEYLATLRLVSAAAA